MTVLLSVPGGNPGSSVDETHVVTTHIALLLAGS
jgi:hypothetical protein